MYEAFFHLRSRAFPSAPSPDRFYSSASMHSARATLSRIIERGEGPGVIIGPAGTGKTLLCQRLAADFADRLSVAHLASGRVCTRRALLQAILYEMRLPYRGMEEGELRLTLIDHVSPSGGDHPGLLLLIDEAHTLPWRLLEEVRMITNLVRGGQPRVRVILAGGPLLEERLASPKLESFSQRLAARCYLGPMTRDETTLFVMHQIGFSGGDPELVFDDSAYEAIYAAAGGVPRLVNQLCDHSLVLAQLAEIKPVGGAVIEEAWSDLQQLPSPWHMTAGASQTNPVIEFAALDESPELPEAIPFRPVAAASLSPIRPEENLDQIQRRLLELEDDFQPAGSIGPEIELRFDSGNLDTSLDAFEETFAEEEVVIDRYASLEADVFANRPLVNSVEGSELARFLKPLVIESDETKFGITAASDSAAAWSSLPQSERKAPAGPAHSAVAAESTTKSAAASVQTMHVVSDSDSDADMIIIEDDPPTPAPQRPAPLVRRQEYRQLFAKLRHG